MKITSIKDFDINNGEGVRVSLWVSGCHFHCDGCHGEAYWETSSGKDFSEDHIDKIIKLLEKDISKDLSILGGEPLEPYNILGVTELCKIIKEEYPSKTIWVWTGNIFENIKGFDVLNYVDVLIDGQFVKSLYDEKLMWRGSSNQRVIDCKESLKQNKVILYTK